MEAGLRPKGNVPVATLPADLCVLAGYMLIVGPEMCTRFNMINLHPAAPGGPTGTWQDVIWQLIKQRARETGVMMHLVTPELDRGPVVSYCRSASEENHLIRYGKTLSIKILMLSKVQREKITLFSNSSGNTD